MVTFPSSKVFKDLAFYQVAGYLSAPSVLPVSDLLGIFLCVSLLVFLELL